MWKTTGYIINLDEMNEDKSQNATGCSSIIINKKITDIQFKRIMKIAKEK